MAERATKDRPAAHPITFDPALARRGVGESVKSWSGAVRAFARGLSPLARAEFLMALDTALYDDQGESAIGAGLHEGLHPKHTLTRYHDFFVANVKAGERVLDLGCGVGALGASIAARCGAHVVGMDWSSANLEKARAAAQAQGLEGRMTFCEGDITSARAPGNFDVVVLSNVLEHIRQRPERLAMWMQWYRPSRLLIRVPAFDRDWRVAWKQQLGVEWRLDPTHETEYTADQLARELDVAGLTISTLTVRWGEYWAVAMPAGVAVGDC